MICSLYKPMRLCFKYKPLVLILQVVTACFLVNHCIAETVPKQTSAGSTDDGADSEGEDSYLYNSADAHPVIEYLGNNTESDPIHPSFIYSPNNGPRIVEFYAPWCPHVSVSCLMSSVSHKL
jgi:hypothetical protein